MRCAGYTLIELLVVISIIGLLGVFSLSSLKGFSKDLVVTKASDEVQTLLRLAQSNATTSTLCNNQGATSWYLDFMGNGTVIQLNCSPGGTPKSYTLVDAKIAIAGAGCTSDFPVKLSYSMGVAKPSWSSAVSSDNNCLQSPIITITISNTKNTSAATKIFRVSKGGAVDVQ